MKKVAFVTYAAAPYRMKQFEEYSKYAEIQAYYISEKMVDRSWDLSGERNFSEEKLPIAFKIKGMGAIHTNLKKIVKANDLIIIGGYSSATYILLSILCKWYKKPSVILLDGISPGKLKEGGTGLKNLIKKFVLHNSAAVFGNGTVAKRYFSEVLNYQKKVYPQILTSNIEVIMSYEAEKEQLRKQLCAKYAIDPNKIIISYSGRLLAQKNVKDIIDALVKLDREDIHFIIFGGGTAEQEKDLVEYGISNNISMSITGFIEEQSLLYKHYYMSDLFILPSINDAWGLVVNEAMAAKLPIIVSDGCGCSLDLVKEGENGYVYKGGDSEELAKKIGIILSNKDILSMGESSYEIIQQWTFKNSAKSFNRMVTELVK